MPRRVDAGMPPGRAAGGGGIGVGGQHRDLGPLDLRRRGRARRCGRAEPEPAAPPRRRAAPCAPRASGARAADRLRPEVLQLAQGGGVERARLHPGDAEVAQPRAHLAGGSGGEGHGEHPLRRVGAGVHAVGDPVGDGAGLAGAGAREDAHRARRAGRRPRAARGRGRRGSRPGSSRWTRQPWSSVAILPPAADGWGSGVAGPADHGLRRVVGPPNQCSMRCRAIDSRPLMWISSAAACAASSSRVNHRAASISSSCMRRGRPRRARRSRP